MPSAPASFATSRPMLPMPTTPRVLPFSSALPPCRALQLPSRVQRSTCRARLAHMSISISACSATDCELLPGACTTATPSFVAAGRSTVSRPTPCRPTTLSRLQAAMRLAVHMGLARNSNPSASAATFRNPASVSSSHTTTRASVSRLAWPAGWMGPARTTRGRSVAIEGGLLWVRGLLARHQHEPRRIERKRRAVEAAVEIHAAPALRPQHRGQLVRGIQPDVGLAEVFAGVGLAEVFARGDRRRRDQTEPPRPPPAGDRIEQVLDPQRPVVERAALLGRQRLH